MQIPSKTIRFFIILKLSLLRVVKFNIRLKFAVVWQQRFPAQQNLRVVATVQNYRSV